MRSTGSLFAAQLAATPFQIFEPLSDIGYYRWVPDDVPSNIPRNLAELKSADDVFSSCGMLDCFPETLLDTVDLPIQLSNDRSQTYVNTFPYGQKDFVSLYVAAQRGVRFDAVSDEEIDFVLGGSALGLLARQSTGEDFYESDANAPSFFFACRIPGCARTVLVSRNKVYRQEYNSFGFQFERAMTGQSRKPRGKVTYINKLHTMKVGEHRVLFHTETDAMHKGEPAEIKCNNPKYWDLKQVFQMISGQCAHFCHGVRRRHTITAANTYTLSEVCETSIGGRDDDVYERLEQNILDGLSALQGISSLDGGQVFQISFEPTGKLSLTPTNEVALLPSNEFVRDLLN